MKVKEIINELNKFDEDCEVMIQVGKKGLLRKIFSVRCLECGFGTANNIAIIGTKEVKQY